MLSNEDIQRLTIPKKVKVEALFFVLNRLEDADDILDDAIYRFAPFSSDDEWQNEADQIFWHSEGMREIDKVVLALSKASELAKHAIHVLENAKEA